MEHSVGQADPAAAAAMERVLLAEYSELKREQVDRIGRRDQLMYATMTAAAGVIAAVLTHTGAAGLLLLPPVCLVLGWTYVRNDRHVVQIREYLRGELGPQLEGLAGGPVLRWENGSPRRRLTQVAVEFVTFVVPAWVALAGYAAALYGHAHLSPLLVPAWVAEFVATLLFTTALVAAVRGGRRR
jgi:hypothetical protein